jgi:hypothetical protein
MGTAAGLPVQDDQSLLQHSFVKLVATERKGWLPFPMPLVHCIVPGRDPIPVEIPAHCQ